VAEKSCFEQHAWVVGICTGVMGVVFLILLALASGWRDADASIEIRVRVVEQSQASQASKLDAIIKATDEIKSDVKELRRQNTKALP